MMRDALRALRSPWLYGCLLLAALLWAAVWQTKEPESVAIGGYQDDAYVRGFHAREHTPDFDYRWSQGDSLILMPGLGNQPVDITLRLAGARGSFNLDPPLVTVLVRGQKFTLQTSQEPADYRFQVERGPDPLEGDLLIEVQAPTFQPLPDPRELGVLVSGVTVEPVTYALRPFVIPPFADMGIWLACLALVFLLAATLLGNTRRAALIAVGFALLIGGLIIWRRPDLGFLALRAPVLMLWTVVLAVIGTGIAAGVLRLAGSGGGRAARLVGGVFALGFLLRFAGLTFPQFQTSDMVFHAHNIEKILRGEILFSSALPDGTVVPYPPGLYVLLSLFAWLVPDLTLLLRFALSVIDAATVFPLLYAAVVLFRSRRAGVLAGWVYAFLPAPFLLFAPGNYSNLFAQFTFVVALAALLRLLARPGAGWGAWLALVGALLLTFVSHYGMLIAAGVVAGFVLLAGLAFGDGALRRRVWPVMGAFALAVLLAFALYYRNFVPEIADQITATLNKVPGGSGGSGEGLLPGVWRMVYLGMAGVPLFAGVLGWGLAPAGRQVRRFLLIFAIAFVLADLVVAALTVAAGDNTRYVLLLAPFVALGGGRFIASLRSRRQPAAIFAALLGTLLLWQSLQLWIDLIYTYRPNG